MPELLLCNPSPLPKVVAEVANQWVEGQHSRLFALILTENLDRILVDKIYDQRNEFENVEVLDVLLDSHGGDIEAAYQLVSLFRHKCKKLRVFVPDWAKSAATLFALGADELWMSETAELGPLDAQIPDPRVPGEYISALDEFTAIDYLRDHGYAIFDQFVMLLLRRTHLKVRDVLHHAIEYSSHMMAPLYSQVDPLYFGGAHRALDMSIQYGKRVMSRHAYSGWDEKKVEELLKKLTRDYPSHSFVIDYIEAKELGLNVNLLSHDLADKAQIILKNVRDCVGFIGQGVAVPLARAAGG
ncbi:MAG TPA: hypothetical protein VGT03_10790 [Candidatus Acidoferrales bacterium]|nr:hypothetical protein [Candidatus Acidoferrales bacterium]